ncbi:hypothetical protein FVO59_06395 [Microbacterium esteraromaticum]|uniref:HTH luxR-type domain-containing protein n=1 Tax=Microbacterium esteraromaticum TaxID=57043 RepID=A0A7D7WEK0_9MICO|nr:hypothetical protein [Microbacterium esteraromaticum]QMU96892.1 hypothetical protein FVO59_06395 [Microbacterium esteraromaticum]
MPEHSPSLGVPGLSAELERVYVFVVHRGPTQPADVSDALGIAETRAADALDALHDIGLIVLSEIGDGAYLPVDPQVALGAVADRLSDQVADLRRQIPDLSEQYQRSISKAPAEPRTLVITDATEIAHWYVRLQHQAGRELLTFDRPPYVSLGMEPLEVSTISRGVTWRVVYAPESFARESAWAEAVRLAGRGEHARIAASLPIKLVIADREIALVGLNLHGSRVEALVTESPLLIGLLAETFERYWDRALPLGAVPQEEVAGADDIAEALGAAVATVTAADGGASRPTPEQQAILALIGAGLTDDAIASQLGFSVRSLRRRSSELMADLGVQNRFQLGVEAARRGWV